MGGYYYITKQGDMWDYIAWKVYGNEKRMETLMRAEENRRLLTTYMFSAGEKVWCPEEAEEVAEKNTAPWRDTE